MFSSLLFFLERGIIIIHKTTLIFFIVLALFTQASFSQEEKPSDIDSDIESSFFDESDEGDEEEGEIADQEDDNEDFGDFSLDTEEESDTETTETGLTEPEELLEETPTGTVDTEIDTKGVPEPEEPIEEGSSEGLALEDFDEEDEEETSTETADIEIDTEGTPEPEEPIEEDPSEDLALEDFDEEDEEETSTETADIEIDTEGTPEPEELTEEDPSEDLALESLDKESDGEEESPTETADIEIDTEGASEPEELTESLAGEASRLGDTSPATTHKSGVRRIPHPNAKLGLIRITKEGVYEYKVSSSPQNYAASVRLGQLSPNNLANQDTGRHFSDLYGDSAPMLLFDYEWQPPYTGPLRVKAGAGLFLAQGNGVFANPDTTLTPKEAFTLVTFPFSLSVIYRAKYWQNQFFVPYVDTGMDMFTFVELRDDGQKTKLGGSLAGHVAIGASLSLGFLGRNSFIELDHEYGVNSIWLTGEVRSVFHMSGRFDFSGNLLNMGFLAEF